MVFIDHKDIIVELWRANIPDPQGRHSSNSESFSATGGQTVFTPTPTAGTPTISLQAVDTVKVNTVLKAKWADYLIDLQTGSIIFRTALSGGETVDIDYQEGSTSWIYPDKPREDLAVSSFPRISLHRNFRRARSWCRAPRKPPNFSNRNQPVTRPRFEVD